MSRPAKKPTPLNNQQQKALYHLFLHILHAVCPEIFSELRKKLAAQRESALAFPGVQGHDLRAWDPNTKRALADAVVVEWACKFKLSDTWIQEEAKQIALIWIDQPGTNAEYLPLTIMGEPDYPTVQEVVLRIPIPFEFRIERPYFSWDGLKAFIQLQVQPVLDAELQRMRRDELESGSSVEIKLPSDLEKRMAVTALYLFRNLSPEEIREVHQQPQGVIASAWAAFLLTGLRRERTVLNRWIQQIIGLLGLEEVKRRRVRSKKPPANVAKARKNVAR